MPVTASVISLADVRRKRQRALVRQFYAALAALEAEAPGVVSVGAREAFDADLLPLVEAERNASERKGHFMGFVDTLGEIWRLIGKLPREDRPQDVRRVLDESLVALEWNTGEVRADRATLAERAGITPARVSLAMSVLERHGIVERSHLPEPGRRGRKARYFVNCHVAWRGSLGSRDELREITEPPLLTLMQGGKRELREARAPFPVSPSGAPSI